MISWTASLAAALVLLAAVPSAAPAAPGDLDRSFAGTGTTTLDFAGGDDRAAAAAGGPRGQVVAAGSAEPRPGAPSDFAIARFSRAGTLDRSFGGDGTVTADFEGGTDFAEEVLLQPDGKVVAVGTVDVEDPGEGDDLGGQAMGVVRYLPDGAPDPAFGGGDGRVVVDRRVFESWDLEEPHCGVGAYAAALTRGGKIVISGARGCGGESDDPLRFAVARLMPDGSLDRSFARDGATSTFAFGSCVALGLAVQRDGKVLLAGMNDDEGGCYGGTFVVTRLKTNGAADRGFGRGGRRAVEIRGAEQAEVTDLLLTPAGRVVLAGGAVGRFGGGRSRGAFALARLNPRGDLDRSFAGDGRQVTSFGRRTSDHADGVALARTGALVVAGTSNPPGTSRPTRIAMARYRSNGGLDRTFSGDGRRTVAGGGAHADLAIVRDGRIVTVGSSRRPGTGANWLLARLRG